MLVVEVAVFLPTALKHLVMVVVAVEEEGNQVTLAQL
jgi:hypothetical protein